MLAGFEFPRGTNIIILSTVSMFVGGCRDEAGGQRLGVIGRMDDCGVDDLGRATDVKVWLGVGG